ncbi:TPR repeat/Tetratricopeptide repeat [Novymonas esmeraldas]|uniref:TPR repeat/Tetratricopeptide repeat n=1 Tax=Novymonas esmeraldas TaxID=1808958 RepID=A0AAW0EW63_9TRYP
MSTAADRQAFLRQMGLTSADIADPDQLPPRSGPAASAVGSGSGATARAQRGAKHSSPTASSSIAGLSYSASLGGDAAQQPSVTTTANTLRGMSPISASGPHSSSSPSRLPFSPPRSVHWEEEGLAAPSSAATRALPSRAGASGSAAAAAVSADMKERGNRAFEAGAFREAVVCYTSAIDALAAAAPHSTAQQELLAALHSNRSAAYLQAAHELPNAEDAYGRALCDAERTVSLRLSWFKGYARQGDACFKLRRYGAAAEAYEMALQLDPHNSTLANALAESRHRAKQAARAELEMRRTTRSVSPGSTSATSSLASTFTGSGAWHGDAGDGGGRRAGHAQQLWAELKEEVESTAHQATGDAYRLQQLQQFRARSSAAATPAATPTAGRAAAAARPPPAGRTPDATSGTAPALDSNVAAAAAARRPDVPPTQPPPSSSSAPSAPPPPPPRRRSSTSPTAGGIPAAMAAFDGPVHNARDVPYEFSSAAASAYQQRLLEEYRQRKATRH